jgi:hypothetical protein
MRRISLLACLCAAFLAATPAAVAQITANKVPAFGAAGQPLTRSAESEQVRNWYRDYLGREPGPELAAWVELLRGGMSPVDVQATILGSDEYFNQQGRDPQTFVLETLQAVTWQAPSGTLLRQWNERLTALRGDRFALAREVLLAYSQPTTTTGQASDIALRLTNAAKLLQDTADFELSGTTQGRQVALRAKSLYDASLALQRTVGVGAYRLDDVLASARTVESAYNAVQATLNNPPGTAPSASAIARRIDSMLNDLQVALMPQTSPVPGTGTPPRPGPIVPTPATPAPSGLGYDQAKLQRQIESVARGTQSLAQLFSSQPSGNYTYRVLLTDLNSFASQVDALEASVARGTSLQRLQWEWQALNAQVERLRPQVQQPNAPTFTRLFWTSVESGMQQMSDTLGIAPNGNPGTVPPPVTTPNVDLVAICDQGVGQIDAFLTGLAPYVFGIPEVPRLQRDMRTVRNQFLTMRQMIVQGSPTAQIQDQARLARLQYDASYEVWSQVVEAYKLSNYTKMSPIGRSLTAVEEGLSGTSSDPNVYLRPGTGSRVGQLITTFDTELEHYSKTLAPFANYPEFRSLSLHVQQLAGYSKTLKELETNRARNLADEQRLVAGMHRVIDLTEAHNTQLEESAKRSNDRNALTQALELRRSLGRIVNLANDLEHEIK